MEKQRARISIPVIMINSFAVLVHIDKFEIITVCRDVYMSVNECEL